MPEPPPIHSQFLPDVYRYAFLMTGSTATASEVLRSTIESASRGLSDDDRKPRRAKRWIFAKAREFCRRPQLLRPVAPAFPIAASSPETAGTPLPTSTPDGISPSAAVEAALLPTVPAADDAANAPNRLAALFALLPEQERSALILFYLYLFDPAELAEVLEIKASALGPLLKEARDLLQQHKVEYAHLLAQSVPTPG